MTHFFKPSLAMRLIAVAVLTACGGGGGGNTAAATVSLAGVVADGYITGAKVCLDKNENSVCEDGEPSAQTLAGGAYTIAGITAGDEAKYPIVAEVPATATDPDSTAADKTVGKAFVLSTPKGNTTITPLSSLVHQELLATPALSAASAAANVKTKLAITADPLKDYIATATRDDDAHLLAQLLTQSVKTNSDAVGTVTTAERKKLQETLFALAKDSVMASPPVQGASRPASVASASAVGFEDFNTVRAVLANKLTTGTASQAVTLNFDVVNGTTPVRVCDALTLTTGLKLWDQTLLSATVPATALAPAAQTAQSVSGKMVDLRFFISNVLLWDAAGNAVPLVMTENNNQSKNVALMDFGRSTATLPACTNLTTTFKTDITGNVVPGTYTAISFTLGVPIRSADLTTKLNHGAATPAQAASGVASANPLPAMDTTIHPSMQWQWQSGRKFTKIEFAADAANDTRNKTNVVVPNFKFHLGSSGSCTGNPVTGNETACTMPNRLGVKLTAFDTAADTVKLDLAALFAGSDLTYDGEGSPGCMSGTTDPECPPIFKALGLGFAAGPTFGKTLTGSAIQTVFKK